MFNRERYERLLSYMTSHEADMVRDLSELCAMPSVRSESGKENEPFGHECALCLEKATGLYRDAGFDTALYEKSGYALATSGNKESKKSICLYCHTDVVPANDEEWIFTKPFEPKQIGNCLIARGAHDNKSAVVASYYFLKALKELEIETNSALQIFLGSNEESGMADVKAFADEQKMPDVSIAPDAGYPAAIGQKGIWRFYLKSLNAFEDIVNISGGKAFNIVLDRVSAKIKRSDALFIELKAKECENIIIEDGNFITVTVIGKAAHAAEAHQGVNAMMLLSQLLIGIDSISKCDKKILSAVYKSLSDSYGTELGIASHSEFFGRTTASCGIVRTVDGRLEYSFDIRFSDVISEEAMHKKVTDFAKANEFEYTLFSLSHCIKRDEELMPIKTFMETYKAITGKSESKPYIMGGGTYAAHVDGGFAIGVDKRDFKMDITLPEGHGDAHQADEVICIPALTKGAAMLAELVLSIDDNM